MIPQETVALIRHLFYAEHWKIGTIASELGLHYDTVRRAVEADRFSRRVARGTLVDPYADFVRETLASYPRLRATRIFQMLQVRGYTGSVNTLRRAVADLRPSLREAFLRLRTFPCDEVQDDWAHFGKVKVGRAERRLSCFVSTLSYSRALYLEFFFDQMLESFLRGHVRTFQDWGGVPRNEPFSTSAVRFSLPGPSPHSRTSTVRLCVGATKSPIVAPGPGTTPKP